MSIEWEEVKDFWEYLEYYPEEDEPGYDGIHDGGIKGISENAPQSVKEQYAVYAKKQEDATVQGVKI